MKNSDKARADRGFTGWVAVTGFPLRINSERSHPKIKDLMKIDNTISEKVLEYGAPEWGHRISEHKTDWREGWSKRYLAVPVKSVNDPDITIGVLRYVCPLESKELTHIDLPILESFAKILSAIVNLERIKIVCSRDIRLELEAAYLQSSGDYDRFLKFVASSMRSAISSLYLPILIENNTHLRLMSAHGISGNVGELREQNKILDYTKITKGLTWEILTSHSESIVHNSVLDSKGWAGLNTNIFYRQIFEALGVGKLHMLDSAADQKQLLSTYSVKLIGMHIGEEGKALGVLKVELPLHFDSSRHYDRDDITFLKGCVVELEKSLAELHSFINCEWFNSENTTNDEFERLLRPIVKNKLIELDECPDFWECITDYIKHNEDSLNKRGSVFVATLAPRTLSKIRASIKKQGDWLPKLLTTKMLDWIIRLTI